MQHMPPKQRSFLEHQIISTLLHTHTQKSSQGGTIPVLTCHMHCEAAPEQPLEKGQAVILVGQESPVSPPSLVWRCLNMSEHSDQTTFIILYHGLKVIKEMKLLKWLIIWYHLTYLDFLICFQPRVCFVGLQKAPQLNGRRGVVEREAKQKHCSENQEVETW